MARGKVIVAESGIGQDERSALLGSASEKGAAALSLDENDPTQQLLLALGHFQRILRSARKGSDDLWSDECMNQLILGVEIALTQSWTQLVDAFTDAGRILQTYESEDRARDALPFLEGSYDLLCGIVGEVMGGGVRPQVLDRWREHYNNAVKDVRAAGLTLVDDDETDDFAKTGGLESVEDSVTPFMAPELYDVTGGNGGDANELPTLDELPPLENMLPMDSDRVSDGDKPEILEEDVSTSISETVDDQAEAAPVLEPSRQSVEPSKVIVDIVDRICDELAELGDRSIENRVLAMEMIEGGVSALKREADKEGYTQSSALCEVMQRGCRLISESKDQLDERFTEICFAFCGVFVEAMDEVDSENIREWCIECEALVEDWAASAEPVTEAEPELVEEAAPQPADVIEARPEPEAAPQIIGAPEAPTSGVIRVESIEEPPEVEDKESMALFALAQEALASGDAGLAKTLALQAAAEIAAAEVAQSESLLQQSEARLKISMDSAVGARGAVKEAEKMVKAGASQVAAGEKALGEAKERTAVMAQVLSEDEEDVGAIDAEVAELQAKRAEALSEIDEAKTRLNEANGSESTVAERLDGLRSAETDGRKRLETARQNVKDFQRSTSEVESQMEKAREMLTEHKMSLEDIRQTIGQPAVKEDATDEPDEELLF